jgi:Ca2+-binding EF-hand superfamily protein
MYRAVILVLALVFSPAVVAAQQPCTTDARQVVNELYRHILERQADAGSAHWVQQLESGRMTVRDVVRAIAKSPEHTQRFFNIESGEGTPYERAVGTMYRHLLSRQPDEAGQRAHAQLAQRNGAGAVVDRILNSAEYNNQFGDWGVPGSGGMRYCGNSAARSQSVNEPGSTTAIRYRGMDRNNDGVISRGEWRGSDRSFRVHDWNNDGVLSGDEVNPAVARAGRTIEDEDFDRGDDFDYLDVNNNGRIEPREWHGSVAAFNRLDVNNDNVLSRAEVLDYGNDSVAATSGDIVYVDPTQRWTNTGINVRAGDLIMFDASGNVTLSSNGNDIAGPGGARSGRRAIDAPLASQTAGALIGMVGNSEPFFIGNRRSVRAPASGRLYLGVNDDHLADNSGSFEVMITVR